MTSAPPAPVEMTFVPLQLVQIQIGKVTVYVYPVVTPNMPIFERAHAFQVVKTATENLPVDMRLIFDAIGTQLNCSAIVDGLLYDWRQTFDDGWYDFANLSIISFHDSAGAQINNTTVAGAPTVLLDVVNGNLANCRQQNVRFVRVSCSIDFAPLFTIRNPGNTILRVGFYLELPQTTVAMTNGAGVAYNLTTWHGASDLSTLTRDEVRALILEPSMQTGPIALSPADFNLGEANTDSIKVLANIHTKIWQLGWKQIMASIFSQLCPGYSDQPHAVLDHIKQSSVGADGQVVTASVYEYYTRITTAARPFTAQAQYSISVCDRFIQGLDRNLLPSFRKNYPNHSMAHDLSSAYQRRQLAIILQAAQAAEDECNQIQDIARKIVSSQGFFMQAQGAVTANPSRAEKTLARYKDGDTTRERPKLNCWGCGGDHTWMRRGVIECPRGTEPQVIANAKKKHAEYVEEIRRNPRRRGRRGNSADPNDPNKRSRRSDAVLAVGPPSQSSTASTASTLSTATVNSIAPVGPKVFMYSAQVLNLAPPSRRVLPVPIQAAFPHITLQFGTALGCENCPAVRCVIDTAAALSTGNLHFFAAIAKQYPHTVASIHSPADYSPITLSGIVQNEGASVTTDLSVAFRFHLPYLTREGTPTSFLVATGRDVTVNAILGLPFIQQTKMVIDAADMVAELKALDTPPFQIDFRTAMCAVPPVDAGTASTAVNHADIIREIENIEAFMIAKKPTIEPQGILLPAKRARRVDFSDASSCDGTVTSHATIGPAVDFSEGTMIYADDSFSLCDVTTSA